MWERVFSYCRPSRSSRTSWSKRYLIFCHAAIYRTAENFAGAKFRENTSRLFKRNFRGFYFCAETNGWRSDHTPTVDAHAPHKNRCERRSEEASWRNSGLVFFLCGGLRNHESIRTADVRLMLFWHIHYFTIWHWRPTCCFANRSRFFVEIQCQLA